MKKMLFTTIAMLALSLVSTANTPNANKEIPYSCFGFAFNMTQAYEELNGDLSASEFLDFMDLFEGMCTAGTVLSAPWWEEVTIGDNEAPIGELTP